MGPVNKNVMTTWHALHSRTTTEHMTIIIIQIYLPVASFTEGKLTQLKSIIDPTQPATYWTEVNFINFTIAHLCKTILMNSILK